MQKPKETNISYKKNTVKKNTATSDTEDIWEHGEVKERGMKEYEDSLIFAENEHKQKMMELNEEEGKEFEK